MLEAFDFNFQPSLDKALILELARLDFVRRHDDLVITGKSGTGKSHVLKALGLRACDQGISLRYARCVDLLDDLHAGLADNTYPDALKAWARPELLIIDDVGLGQVKPARRRAHRGAHPLQPRRPKARKALHGRLLQHRPAASGAATSATPPSPLPSSTASPCMPSASTSTAQSYRQHVATVRAGRRPETRTTDGRTDTAT